MFQIFIDNSVVSRMQKTHSDILEIAGVGSFPVNLYFLTKIGNSANWQQCKLATVLIVKISSSDPPIYAFDEDISYFGII